MTSFKLQIIVLSVFIFTSLSLALRARRHKIDSLNSIAATQGEDTSRLRTLNELALSMDARNPGTMINVAREAVCPAQKLNSRRGLSDAYRNFGFALNVKGGCRQALDYFLKSLKIAPDIQPAGETENPKPFTAYSFQSPPAAGIGGGTCIYLFTDGYADRFGGPKVKNSRKNLQL